MRTALLAVLLAATALADVTVRGKTFQVTCHFNSKRIAREALEVAETTWPAAIDYYGLTPRKPRERHTVHLFRRREEFDAACLTLDGKRWPHAAGLTTSDGVVLVHVGENLTSAVFGRHVLTRRDRHLIAHETTHVAGRHAPGFAAHPEWLREGSAEWIADRVLGGDDARQALADARASTVQDLVRRNALPDAKALLASQVGSLDTHERYALFGAFVDFAKNERPESLRRALRAKGPKLSNAQVNGLFLASQDEDVLDELGDDFGAYLASQQPSWHLGPGHFEPREDGGWLQLALAEERAIVWRAREVSHAYTLTGGLQIPGRGEPAVRVLFGHSLHWDDAGVHWREAYHSVAFDTSGVRLVRHVAHSRDEGGKMREVEIGRGVTELEPGKDHPFEVMVAHDSLAVTLDGESVLQWRFEPGSATAGHWGVATDAGGVGRWSELREHD
ncbi:MAG: hypothetical protein GY711_35805 [bacterium]|nr:hypothetical protein [bacterium]